MRKFLVGFLSLGMMAPFVGTSDKHTYSDNISSDGFRAAAETQDARIYEPGRPLSEYYATTTLIRVKDKGLFKIIDFGRDGVADLAFNEQGHCFYAPGFADWCEGKYPKQMSPDEREAASLALELPGSSENGENNYASRNEKD